MILHTHNSVKKVLAPQSTVLRFHKILYCGNLEETAMSKKVFGRSNSHVQCQSYSRNNDHLEMSFSTIRYIHLNFLHFRSDFFTVKFSFSEKATKICTIFLMVLTFTRPSQKCCTLLLMAFS